MRDPATLPAPVARQAPAAPACPCGCGLPAYTHGLRTRWACEGCGADARRCKCTIRLDGDPMAGKAPKRTERASEICAPQRAAQSSASLATVAGRKGAAK